MLCEVSVVAVGCEVERFLPSDWSEDAVVDAFCVPEMEGARSLLSSTVLASNRLRAARNVGLSMLQSLGQEMGV